MESLEGEPRYESVSLQEKKEFDVPEAWQEIWDSWPESYRNYLIPIIETGNMTPELYRALGVTFEVSATDKPAPEHYNFPDENCCAEVNYNKRTIRIFPEITKAKTPITHILSHELGHFLGAGLIDYDEYQQMVENRPSWANGRYIQLVKERAPKEHLHEMLADDLGDYLKSKTPEEMLAHRLQRAGNKDELHQYSEEDFEKLQQEATQLFEYFKKMLNPTQKPQQTTQDKWLTADGLEEFDFTQDVMGEVGQELWESPQPRGDYKKGTTKLIDWIFGKSPSGEK